MGGQWDPDTRVMLPMYPTTGPGYFTMDETGDEILMNPNTVDLNDESGSECIVGNITFDDEEAGYLSNNAFDEAYENYGLSLCIGYAENQIENGGEEINGFDPNPSPGPGTITTDERVIVSYGAWEAYKQVRPLLKQYEKWTQSLNKYMPKRSNWWQIFNVTRRNAYVGCFNLAIAKLYLYHLYPQYYNFKGRSINLATLQGTPTTEKQIDDASYFLWGVAEHSNRDYYYQGTFVWPKNAIRNLRERGYNTVVSHSFEFVYVEDRVDTNNPVIVYAMPNINITKSHAWNIDGYKKMKREKITQFYDEGVMTSKKVEIEYKNMVYCDFGWGGLNNGYYVSGIFNSESEDLELDNPSYGKKKINYNNHLRVITHDSVNK